MAVRVRFAPSPTGALHIGSVRTILYNYFLAQKEGGSFILRIEDTDQKRWVAGAEAYILESLRWLGIVPDEGPQEGGAFGPYKQSERIGIYQKYIQPLLDRGHAYYAFDTPAEIEAMRERLKAAKVANPQYNATSREWMRNGLTMPIEQVKEWIAAGKPYVIRLKMPHKTLIRFRDGIRGWVKVDTTALDDKVLMKSDGLPTYHFASVIDDHLMQISHVIRGEEWLPSTPIHIWLYRCLGWGDIMPQFIHLPLLLAPDGQGKLSKRHADQYGFPAFPIAWNSPDLTVEKAFREAGYLPEALLNFLALLGWNPGTHQEIFTKKGLIEAFSLERLGKSGVKFDMAKAKWFNQQHIKKQGPTAWANYFITEAVQENVVCSQQDVIAICNLVKDRITFPKDFWQEGRFFFFDPVDYNAELIQKKWNHQTKEGIMAFHKGLASLVEWNRNKIKQLLEATPISGMMPLLRMALTGKMAGPDLIEIIVLLGTKKTHTRIAIFLEQMG
ncbi:glutamate--tRNA ligase [Candidatus Cardinium hertigii]|uniref:glutamate--tRNA ligase n=1 Tax=Candidatus Cardinium hertigii TaxID=247481 RepID=UPI003D7C75B7